MIAAHKTLRFGAHVRGTYLDNGRVVMVTVVDRGPLIRGRVIDVCASAADELGFRQAGVRGSTRSSLADGLGIATGRRSALTNRMRRGRRTSISCQIPCSGLIRRNCLPVFAN